MACSFRFSTWPSDPICNSLARGAQGWHFYLTVPSRLPIAAPATERLYSSQRSCASACESFEPLASIEMPSTID